MSALEMGAKRGCEYLSRIPLEMLATMTLNEYCALGRLDARQHYKLKRAQDDYARGWFEITTSFVSLFKPDDNDQIVAEKEIEILIGNLEQAEASIRKLLTWRKDNYRISNHLTRALDDLEETQCSILDLKNYIKSQSK